MVATEIAASIFAVTSASCVAGQSSDDPVISEDICCTESDGALGSGADTSGVSLSVVPGVPAGDIVPVLVTVKTPPVTARTPVDIIIVLDVSASMGQEATIQGAGGLAESNGLSLLDVAKHGVRTVVKSLSALDRFSLILFNSEATTTVPLKVMDESGQKEVDDKLNEFNSGGGTDIWKGLASALEEIDKAAPMEPARLSHIMLLTDGESQNRDTIVPNLTQYKQAKERLPGTVSTFGFGYSIDSALLVDLAMAGDGTYSFIPDAGFVGTVFVNTLSNLLVTIGRETYLNLDCSDSGSEIVSVRGGYRGEKTSWGMRIPIGTLQCEQSKDVVVLMKMSDTRNYISVSAQFEGIGGIPMTIPAAEGVTESQDVEVNAHCLRSCFVESLAKIAAGTPVDRGVRPASLAIAETPAMELPFSLVDATAVTNLAEAAAFAAKLAEIVKSSSSKSDARVAALLEDIEGQTAESLAKKDWWNKWGRHYTPSLMFAHKLQQCNNFKDPGVQLFGGELFKKEQDAADELFNQLPAPKPSVRRSSYAATPVQSMASYNNCYGG